MNNWHGYFDAAPVLWVTVAGGVLAVLALYVMGRPKKKEPTE